MDLNPLHRKLSVRFRRRRMERLAETLKLTPDSTVLDVGGNPAIWDFCPVRPKVTTATIQRNHADVVADGCQLPFGDKVFDVAFSNSVIEHVADQEAFAAEIRRVGRSYWVQCPDWRTWIEPHYFGSPVHRMPARWRRTAARWATLAGYLDRQWIDILLDEVRLPTEERMRAMFPYATILHERFLGTPKALIAVR